MERLPPLPDDGWRPAPGPAPGALTGYRVYAALMAALFGFALVALSLHFAFPGVFGPEPTAADASRIGRLFRIAVLSTSFATFVAFVASFFVPRRPWAWVYHLLLIVFGLSSPCLWPGTVPLLIFWLKPETRLYFGLTPR